MLHAHRRHGPRRRHRVQREARARCLGRRRRDRAHARGPRRALLRLRARGLLGAVRLGQRAGPGRPGDRDHPARACDAAARARRRRRRQAHRPAGHAGGAGGRPARRRAARRARPVGRRGRRVGDGPARPRADRRRRRRGGRGRPAPGAGTQGLRGAALGPRPPAGGGDRRGRRWATTRAWSARPTSRAADDGVPITAVSSAGQTTAPVSSSSGSRRCGIRHSSTPTPTHEERRGRLHEGRGSVAPRTSTISRKIGTPAAAHHAIVSSGSPPRTGPGSGRHEVLLGVDARLGVVDLRRAVPVAAAQLRRRVRGGTHHAAVGDPGRDRERQSGRRLRAAPVGGTLSGSGDVLGAVVPVELTELGDDRRPHLVVGGLRRCGMIGRRVAAPTRRSRTAGRPRPSAGRRRRSRRGEVP